MNDTKHGRFFTGSVFAFLMLLAYGTLHADDSGFAAVEETPFGVTRDGQPVALYTLRRPSGMQARITNFGGIVVSLTAPDREGVYEDVVLGFESLAEYEAQHPYFGALIGRYGNRIAGGRFTLDGQDYTLATNNGPNHLHGGLRGFDKVVWEALPEVTPQGPGLRLRYLSPDGEEGYPGNLDATVRYILAEDDTLLIEYTASSDAPTPVNLTHHGYFNLSGAARRDILGHWLEINADRYTPVDATLIPTGELREVTGSVFDFRSPRGIGEGLAADDEQLRHGQGYDHNWVLNVTAAGEMLLAARLGDPVSGRVMSVYTTEPGLQFYSGNFLDGSLSGKGVRFDHRMGLCLETQHFPDSPNQPSFPNTILRPGETLRSTTRYVFSVTD